MDEDDNLSNDETNNYDTNIINVNNIVAVIDGSETNSQNILANTDNNTSRNTPELNADDDGLPVVMRFPTGISIRTASANMDRIVRAPQNRPTDSSSTRVIMEFSDWASNNAASEPTVTGSTATSTTTAAETPTTETTESTAVGVSTLPPKPSFFFSTSSFSLRSRKEVAALINEECCRGGSTPDLDSIMDTLFHPGSPIDNADNIEWIRWLIAGGRTPQEFVKIGKTPTENDNVSFFNYKNNNNNNNHYSNNNKNNDDINRHNRMCKISVENFHMHVCFL